MSKVFDHDNPEPDVMCSDDIKLGFETGNFTQRKFTFTVENLVGPRNKNNTIPKKFFTLWKFAERPEKNFGTEYKNKSGIDLFIIQKKKSFYYNKNYYSG